MSSVNLTPGAIIKLFTGECRTVGLQPVVQAVDLRAVPLAGGVKYMFRLSDGCFFLNAVGDSNLINELVKSEILQKGSVILLTDYECKTIAERRVIRLLRAHVIVRSIEIIGKPELLPFKIIGEEKQGMKHSNGLHTDIWKDIYTDFKEEQRKSSLSKHGSATPPPSSACSWCPYVIGDEEFRHRRVHLICGQLQCVLKILKRKRGVRFRKQRGRSNVKTSSSEPKSLLDELKFLTKVCKKMLKSLPKPQNEEGRRITKRSRGS